jgi:hypothetical protein
VPEPEPHHHDARQRDHDSDEQRDQRDPRRRTLRTSGGLRAGGHATDLDVWWVGPEHEHTDSQATGHPATEGLRPSREGTHGEGTAGNYPIPDRGHAISAIRRASREYERGNLTKKEHDRIQRKAEKMLRKKSGKKAAKKNKKKK